MQNNQFRIVATVFGYPMWVSAVGAGWSDNAGEATVFNRTEGDNPDTKLKWFRAFWSGMGLDAGKVNVEYVG